MEERQMSDVTSAGHRNLETASPLGSLTLNASEYSKTVARMTMGQAAIHGLSPSEFSIIRLLLSGPEWTVGDVAKTLQSPISTTSKTVSRLADRGLVYKRRPLDNRRTVLLRLTEEGVSVGMELLEEIHSSERSVIRDIDPGDLENCLATFSKLVENTVAWEERGSDDHTQTPEFRDR